MLRINRIKAISKTESGTFGFDYLLADGLNLISSNANTRGKSSAILAIYYCLGFEEIIGGRGKKTLTSVYKTVVEDDEQIMHPVLESIVLHFCFFRIAVLWFLGIEYLHIIQSETSQSSEDA